MLRSLVLSLFCFTMVPLSFADKSDSSALVAHSDSQDSTALVPYIPSTPHQIKVRQSNVCETEAYASFNGSAYPISQNGYTLDAVITSLCSARPYSNEPVVCALNALDYIPVVDTIEDAARLCNYASDQAPFICGVRSYDNYVGNGSCPNCPYTVCQSANACSGYNWCPGCNSGSVVTVETVTTSGSGAGSNSGSIQTVNSNGGNGASNTAVETVSSNGGNGASNTAVETVSSNGGNGASNTAVETVSSSGSNGGFSSFSSSSSSFKRKRDADQKGIHCRADGNTKRYDDPAALGYIVSQCQFAYFSSAGSTTPSMVGTAIGAGALLLPIILNKLSH